MKATCFVTVIGMDIQCPLCGETVPDGSHHQCKQENGKQIRSTIRISTTPPNPRRKPARLRANKS
jgi:hypothetical protein